MVGKNPDEGEVMKSDGYPERCLLSPTRLSQVNKVDEATQGERVERHLRTPKERDPGKNREGVIVSDEVEQEVYDENFKKCAKMEKTVKEAGRPEHLFKC